MYTSDAPNLTPPDDAARSDAPIAQPSSLPPLAESLNWLSHFRRYSRLLVAVIEPTTLTLRYGNDHFYNVVGVSQQETGAATNLGDALPQLLSAASNQAIERLYRRHLVHRVFSQQYGVNLDQCRLLDEPLLLTLNSPLYPEPRCVEVWLRS
ncbi:hypothetical protein H6F43_19640, partial [Leptolyngbya sp. FACHB-36]|nr:hypothetical protein [Leptolyngbya sp. FACHB-36]